jgi:hypothetical protein
VINTFLEKMIMLLLLLQMFLDVLAKLLNLGPHLQARLTAEIDHVATNHRVQIRDSADDVSDFSGFVVQDRRRGE